MGSLLTASWAHGWCMTWSLQTSTASGEQLGGSRKAWLGLGSCHVLRGCTELSCVIQGLSEGKKPLDEAEDQVEQS